MGCYPRNGERMGMSTLGSDAGKTHTLAEFRMASTQEFLHDVDERETKARFG